MATISQVKIKTKKYLRVRCTLRLGAGKFFRRDKYARTRTEANQLKGILETLEGAFGVGMARYEDIVRNGYARDISRKKKRPWGSGSTLCAYINETVGSPKILSNVEGEGAYNHVGCTSNAAVPKRDSFSEREAVGLCRPRSGA